MKFLLHKSQKKNFFYVPFLLLLILVLVILYAPIKRQEVWLERISKTVIRTTSPFEIEFSRIQYGLLPDTYLKFNDLKLFEAGDRLGKSFLIKTSEVFLGLNLSSFKKDKTEVLVDLNDPEIRISFLEFAKLFRNDFANQTIKSIVYYDDSVFNGVQLASLRIENGSLDIYPYFSKKNDAKPLKLRDFNTEFSFNDKKKESPVAGFSWQLPGYQPSIVKATFDWPIFYDKAFEGDASIPLNTTLHFNRNKNNSMKVSTMIGPRKDRQRIIHSDIFIQKFLSTHLLANLFPGLFNKVDPIKMIGPIRLKTTFVYHRFKSSEVLIDLDVDKDKKIKLTQTGRPPILLSGLKFQASIGKDGIIISDLSGLLDHLKFSVKGHFPWEQSTQKPINIRFIGDCIAGLKTNPEKDLCEIEVAFQEDQSLDKNESLVLDFFNLPVTGKGEFHVAGKGIQEIQNLLNQKIFAEKVNYKNQTRKKGFVGKMFLERLEGQFTSKNFNFFFDDIFVQMNIGNAHLKGDIINGQMNINGNLNIFSKTKKKNKKKNADKKGFMGSKIFVGGKFHKPKIAINMF